MFGGRPEVVLPAGSPRLSWHVAASPTSDYAVGRSSSASSACRGGSSSGGGSGGGGMAAPACSVRYFCLGALLIFVGSVLLCALGFTIVLPHEATAHWPRAVCTVVNATYNRAHCSCDQQVTEYDRCVERYPCLQVTVGFNRTSHTLGVRTSHIPGVRTSNTPPPAPPARPQTRVAFTTGILYRNWVDSFFKTCSIHECGDEEWNVKEAHRFLRKWGRLDQTYPCYYDPDNVTSLVLERMPTAYVVHALFWPALSLLCGTLIWMGLCFGCWRIEIENTYPQRHVGPYGLL